MFQSPSEQQSQALMQEMVNMKQELSRVVNELESIQKNQVSINISQDWPPCMRTWYRIDISQCCTCIVQNLWFWANLHKYLNLMLVPAQQKSSPQTSLHFGRGLGRVVLLEGWLSINFCLQGISCNSHEAHDDQAHTHRHTTEPLGQEQTVSPSDTSEQQTLALMHRLAKMHEDTQQEMAKMHTALQTLSQVVQESIQHWKTQ